MRGIVDAFARFILALLAILAACRKLRRSHSNWPGRRSSIPTASVVSEQQLLQQSPRIEGQID